MRSQGFTRPESASQASWSQGITMPVQAPHPVLQLQAAVGNRAVNQILVVQPQPIQLKPLLPRLSQDLTQDLQLQKQSLLKPKTEGEKLPETVQIKMETALNTDFSDVRIHEGSEAEKIGASAYTSGSDIYFAAGQYSPTTITGQELLGHELTHVRQQRLGQVAMPSCSSFPINTDPRMEAEADRLGAKAARTEYTPSRGADIGVQKSISSANRVIQCSFLDAVKYYLARKTRARRYQLGKDFGFKIGKTGRRGAQERGASRPSIIPDLLETDSHPKGLKVLDMDEFSEKATRGKSRGNKGGDFRTRKKKDQEKEWLVKKGGGYGTEATTQEISEMMAIREAMAGDFYRLILEKKNVPLTRLIKNQNSRIANDPKYYVGSRSISGFSHYSNQDLITDYEGLTKTYIAGIFLGEEDIKSDNFGKDEQGKHFKIDHGESLGKKFFSIETLEEIDQNPTLAEEINPIVKQQTLDRIVNLEDDKIKEICDFYEDFFHEYRERYGEKIGSLIGTNKESYYETLIARREQIKQKLRLESN